MGWVRDALVALEEVCYSSTEDLPSSAPVLTRPTLRLHFGIIQEHEMGLYDSPGRKSLESDLLQEFLSRYHAHIASVGPVRAGQEGTSASQYDVLFRRDGESVQARQSLRDHGYHTVQTQHMLVVIPVRDGPGRLPSSLTKIVISNLPADFMTRGVTRCLLESAGYDIGEGGEGGSGTGVAIRAEFGGEQKPEIAARFPAITKLGVVVAIVRTPSTDPSLSALPRKLQDGDSNIIIAVSGHQVRKASAPHTEGTQVPGFVPQQQPADAQSHLPPQRLRLQRPLDAVTDLRSRRPHDRRGLGASSPVEQAASPIFGSFHDIAATASARAHRQEDTRMVVDMPTAPAGAQLMMGGPPQGTGGADMQDVRMRDPQSDPAAQILSELDEPTTTGRSYPSSPLAEACHTWLLDNEVALDYAEAVNILSHFYLTHTPLWETFAEDGSMPPKAVVLKSMLLSTRTELATSVVHPSTGPELPQQNAAPAVLPHPPGFAPQQTAPDNQVQSRRAQERALRATGNNAPSRPRRSRQTLPWYHSDRLKGGPPRAGPRGQQQ